QRLSETPLPDTHSGATRYSPHRYHFNLLNKDAELITLRKENARLKEANEILKLASAFFAQAELDRKLK
ncbi:hypothetical protein QP446_11025, partial [Corynebacterium riegelii]|uniref:hypothetical protein n=1 Tax=Corynebacterium riegelii TaxID=156976 RepID=UPI00254D7861